MSRNRICITLLIGILLLNVEFVSAQTELRGSRRFDAGGQFTLRKIRFRSTEDTNACGPHAIFFHACVPHLVTSNRYESNLGFGGRLGFMLSKRVTVDGILNYFPFVMASDRLPRGIQGLAGVKSGWRGSQYGFFGKARPGFYRYNDQYHQSAKCAGKTEYLAPCYVTQFQFDLGGVIEIYPSGVFVPRIDVSDIVTRIGRDIVGVGPRTEHSLQIGIGVGVRF